MFKKLAFFVLVFVLIGFVSASINFSPNNHSIIREYGFQNKISGWINISLNNEPINTILTGKFDSSVGKNISLLDLIKKNPNFVVDCDSLHCDFNYMIEGIPLPLMSFTLSSRQSKLVGLNITGEDINTISSFSMNLTTNGGISDTIPLTLDILSDEEIEWEANAPAEIFNTPNYGCYNSSRVSSQPANILIDDSYCETITLRKSPSVKIGANIIGTTAGNFTMSISDNEGYSNTCIAAGINGAINCSVEDFPILTDREYAICIIADEIGHKINRNERTNLSCGFSGDFTGTYNGDFEIFAQTKKYAPVRNIVINDSEPQIVEGEEIGIQMEQYIQEKYGSNCSRGCIIPIKITSEISQNINLSGVKLAYKQGLIGFSENINLFGLNEAPAKLTSSYQKLYLDGADFHVPIRFGNYTFSFLINGRRIFSEKINVTNGLEVLYILPISTAVNYSTEFKAFVVGVGNVSKYTWDFGDGTVQNTTEATINHKYTGLGNYTIKVTVLSKAGKTSFNTFEIGVFSIPVVIRYIFNRTKEDVANLKTQLNSSQFSLFERRVLNSSLNFTDIDNQLAEIEIKISAASTETEFQDAFNQLTNLNLPRSIQKTDSGNNILFYPDLSVIDLDILKTITGESYNLTQEGDYKEAILSWAVENTQINLNFSEISANFNGYSEVLLKTFDVTAKKTSNNNTYLIMQKMENLIFEESYSKQTVGDYYYFLLDNSPIRIKFSTTDSGIDFSNLPIFISPKMTEIILSDSEVIVVEPDDDNNSKIILTNPGLFYTLVAIVLIAAVIAWIFIQKWYASKYEHYLFKNKENLNNIINYIVVAKQKGIDEKTMLENLKKVGWTSEQIKYVLEKYAKRTKIQQENQ